MKLFSVSRTKKQGISILAASSMHSCLISHNLDLLTRQVGVVTSYQQAKNRIRLNMNRMIYYCCCAY